VIYYILRKQRTMNEGDEPNCLENKKPNRRRKIKRLKKPP